MVVNLREGAAQLGVELDDAQLAQFELYGQLIREWNRKISLTTVDDPQGITERHFLDSLTCVAATNSLNGQRLVDVGSGAGFPGLALKIAFPQMRLTLVESVGKKARFLEAVVAGLDLHDVIIMNERAEVVGQEKSHRQQYDWAVARAVAPLETLVEYLLPLCKLGGHALAQKGPAAADEAVAALTAIARLGGAEPGLRPVRLPGRSDVSYLVIIEKIRETPDRYPRRPGRPAKRPL